MKQTAYQAAALIAVCAMGLATLSSAHAQPASPGALIDRMIAATRGVQSYTAAVHADIAMRTFPYLNPSLDGILYHKEPSRNKIVFTSGLPFIARQFSNIYPQLESPSRWAQVYVISSEGDDGAYTTLRLVPRKHGRIDHIDAKIDDKTAEVVSMRWVYNDGGFATMDQTYGSIQGRPLVTQQTGHVEVPHYTVDLKSTFSDFKINANIPDSVFDQSS